MENTPLDLNLLFQDIMIWSDFMKHRFVYNLEKFILGGNNDCFI